MINNLESPILILHQESALLSALFTMECLLFTMAGLQFRKTCVRNQHTNQLKQAHFLQKCFERSKYVLQNFRKLDILAILSNSSLSGMLGNSSFSRLLKDVVSAFLLLVNLVIF